MTASRARSSHETRIITAAEVTVWMQSAAPGDRLVYCTGPAMLPGPTLDKLLDLTGAGRVVTHKRRRGAELEHYLVVQRPPIAVTVEAKPDAALEAIFAALARCARRGKRAYSNFELAKIANLATRNQAAWRVRKLAEEKRIRIETVEGPDRTPWRVVIVEGRSSARPKGGSHAD